MSDNANIDHSKKRPAYVAYTVRDAKDDSYWTRIGVCWASKDGKGFVLQLNAVPLDGRVVLREPDGSK
jgi:hypothetical protein